MMYIDLRPTVRYFIFFIFTCRYLCGGAVAFFATLVEFILIKLIPLAYFNTHTLTQITVFDKSIGFDSHDKNWLVFAKNI